MIVSMVILHCFYTLSHFLPQASGFLSKMLNLLKILFKFRIYYNFQKLIPLGIRLPPCAWCTCDDSNASGFAPVLLPASQNKAQLSGCRGAQFFTVQNSVNFIKVFDLFFKPHRPHNRTSSINHASEARSRVEGFSQWKIVFSLLQRIK